MQRVQTLQSIESIDAPYLHVFTNPAICMITTLKYYLARTNLLRCTPNKKKCFFIDPNRPYPVSKDSIAQWTNVVVFESAVDVALFKAHSLKQNQFMLIN